jgi:hypothetical protein
MLGSTATVLLILHLVVTYTPKIIDAVQGVQQIEINKQNQKLDQWMIQQTIQNQKVGSSRPTSLVPISKKHH